jgi:hypothetical protein
MNLDFRAACIAGALIISGTAIAEAQGGSTDRNGNAIGSEHVGNGAATTMQPAGNTGTTGISSGGGQAARDNPNGSPGGAPKAHTGPGGDPSKSEDGKR